MDGTNGREWFGTIPISAKSTILIPQFEGVAAPRTLTFIETGPRTGLGTWYAPTMGWATDHVAKKLYIGVPVLTIVTSWCARCLSLCLNKKIMGCREGLCRYTYREIYILFAEVFDGLD